MRKAILISCLCNLVLAPLLAETAEGRPVTSFREEFQTTTYRDDTWTIAVWDTVAGEIRLPAFEITELGTYDSAGYALDIVLFDEYALLADGARGLVVLDITDRSTPTFAGVYDPTGPVENIAVAGHHAFLAAGTSGLLVVDISDPTAPTLTDSYPLILNPIHDVAVDGDRAFLATDDQYLVVVDISDPTNVVWAASLALTGDLMSVEVAGDIAYVAAGTAGLHMVDITDPDNPVLAGTFDTPGSCEDLALCGAYALIADGASGVQVVDVSKPTKPKWVGGYDTPGVALDICLCGNFAYVADEARGVHVLSLQSIASPQYVMTFNAADEAQAVAVAGEYGCVADGTDGLRVLHVANDAIDDMAAASIYGSYIKDFVLAGQYAFVAEQGDFRVVDLGDPGNPAEVGIAADPVHAVSVAVAGNHAYVVDQSLLSLLVFDIDPPGSPTLVASVPIPFAEDIEIAGDFAYVAAADSGLVTLNISDPALPVRVGGVGFTGAEDLAVFGDYVIVACGGLGVRILDILDPVAPHIWSLLTGPGYFSQVVVEGNFAYVAAGDGGLCTIDVSDPPAGATITNTYLPLGAAWSCLAVAVENSNLVSFWSYDYEFGYRCVRTDISDQDSYQMIRWDYLQGPVTNPVIGGDFAFGSRENWGLEIYHLFDRVVLPNLDEARSLPLTDLRDPVVWMNAVPEGPRPFTLSVGSDDFHWDQPSSAEVGVMMPNPGPWPRWKCNLISDPTYGTGVMTALDVEWKYEYALIDSIVDVPDDQGGWVRIHFSPSGYDVPIPGRPDRIDDYFVFTRVDDEALASRVLEDGRPLAAAAKAADRDDDAPLLPPSLAASENALALDDRQFFLAETYGDFPPGVWEVVGVCPAFEQETYLCRVPTARDSTAAETVRSMFCVFAQEASPGTGFHVSPPDSGCSADNIAPGVPANLAVAYAANGNELDWDPVADSDFQYFRVYRDVTPGFEPSPETLVHLTADTGWLDEVADGWDYSYLVTAVDYAGNESEPAALSSASAVETPGPRRNHLAQNHPNPFNPITTIRFELAESARADLRIFDLKGRLVRTLLADCRLPAGPGQATWLGRDDRGREVPSGVYFYKLTAEEFAQTRRMTLVR